MDETKVQIGEDVLLNIGIHSGWYISSIGYDGESVDVALSRKADRNKEWWVADTPLAKLKAKSKKSFRSVWVDDEYNEIGTLQTDHPCNTCANKGDHAGECKNCVADSEPIRWKIPSHYKPKQTAQKVAELQKMCGIKIDPDRIRQTDCTICEHREHCHYLPQDIPWTDCGWK